MDIRGRYHGSTTLETRKGRRMPITVNALPTNVVPLHAAVPRGAMRPVGPDADAPSIRLLHRDQEVFAEGDAAESFFEVIAGAVRSYKLLSDGRRQINAFHLRGSMFGIEAGTEHRFCAEAIGEVTLRAFKRRRLEALAANDPALACRVVDAMVSALQRAHDHMLLLGRKSAREKVASFLGDLARQTPDAVAIEVPMSRGDMADHLGLTIETVSRTLTRLQRDGLIQLVSSRVIRIACPLAMRRVAEGEGARRLDGTGLPSPPALAFRAH